MNNIINIKNNKSFVLNLKGETNNIIDNTITYISNSEARYLSELDSSKKYDLIVNRTINSIFNPNINQNTFTDKIGYVHGKEFDITYQINGVSFKVSDGIPYYATTESRFLKLQTYVNHNLKEGDFISISNRSFTIFDFGEDVLLEKRTIRIIIDPFLDISTYGTLKRLEDPNNLESVCEYYIEKIKFLPYKVITSILPLSKSLLTNTISNTQTGGPNSVISNQNNLIMSNNINIEGLKNENLMPLYELKIVSQINGFLNTIIWDFNRYGEELSNADTIRPVKFFNNLDLVEIYGDFVEFNPISFTKKIISKGFNKVYSDNSSLPFFGYYNNLTIKLFAFDETIFTSQFKEDAPNYAVFNSNVGLWFWRNVIPYSSVNEDVINFPFINKKHIIYNKWDFVIENELYNQNSINETNNFLKILSGEI